MSLPNPGMSFTPLDPLAASEQNDLVENIEALAAGTGLDDAVITPDKLATGASVASVATSQSTGSSSATDLATVGPSITATIGDNGLALLIVQSTWTPAGGDTEAGQLHVVVSGASTVAAFIIVSGRPVATVGEYLNGSYLLTGLTAGSNTFKMQYSVSGSTGAFAARRLSVIPL